MDRQVVVIKFCGVSSDTVAKVGSSSTILRVIDKIRRERLRTNGTKILVEVSKNPVLEIDGTPAVYIKLKGNDGVLIQRLRSLLPEHFSDIPIVS